jgi:ribosomal protein S18 acetylase RimI-like enzyme
MPEKPRIAWCGNPLRARELADFFAANVGSAPEYISHSELQGWRALSPEAWRPGLPEILLHEIEPRLLATEQGRPGDISQPIAVAEAGGQLVAVSLVTFAGSAPVVPFAIVEDLVVDRSRRSRGIGKAVVDWVAVEARARNIHRIFLESSHSNERAHRFFEREGFRTCSIVMMREI